MTWTDERVSELTRLWEAGHSASAIGKQLGVSKNSVVGKAHRMKLQARPSPIKRDGVKKARPRASVIVTVPKSPIRAVPPPEPMSAPRPRLRHSGKGPDCLWPIGDPGDSDFHFCGQAAVAGKPYCAAHCAKAYITKSRTDSRAA